MPDIDDLQADLFDVCFLLFPPLITKVLNKLAALNPYGPVPLKILQRPLLMDTRVHLVLQGQHVDQCLSQASTS